MGKRPWPTALITLFELYIQTNEYLFIIVYLAEITIFKTELNNRNQRIPHHLMVQATPMRPIAHVHVVHFILSFKFRKKPQFRIEKT